MDTADLADDFYDQIKPRLLRRIGREIRLAHRILDIGCGSCELGRYLVDAYRQEVLGVDIAHCSPPASTCAQTSGHLRCLQRDAANLGILDGDSIDAVVSVWALHEMSRPRVVLSEAYRVLRPGGELVVIEFPRDSLAQKLWDEHYFRPRELGRLLTAVGFSEIRVFQNERGQILWVQAHKSINDNRSGHGRRRRKLA